MSEDDEVTKEIWPVPLPVWPSTLPPRPCPEMTVEDFLDELDLLFKSEETNSRPHHFTVREYTARQARETVAELRYKIAEYNAAVALEDFTKMKTHAKVSP